jgi:hypothetical protein
MRKMFWYCTAATVMVVAVALTTACYSTSHPQSLAGRAVAMALEMNPVVSLGQFIGHKSMKLIKEVQPSAPVASRSCCREVPKEPTCKQPAPEIIDLSRLIDVSAASDGETSEPPSVDETPTATPAQVETVGPVGIEEQVEQVESEPFEAPENIKGLIREISEVILSLRG